MTVDRRTILTLAAASVATSLPATSAAAQSQTPARANGQFQARPLTFDPTAVPGLSERLLVSHHSNNYVGAVRRLGQIVETFAGLDPANTPGFTINGLKREELTAWNSMILHELYFSGFGVPSPAGAALGAALERDFGSHDRWTAEFKSMGKALGGGSGWALLTWSARDGRLVNQWAADHTMTLAGSTPILALDMYEHAYALDYGANAGGYVDAFMAALDWRAATALHAKLEP
ncbi:superoxide dismutase [Brevundimonas vesicularis]|uniref:superoxide dismutase n=1 Tax=Brevundimonas vesicularis TaxID=41276 RepID=UPI0038D4DBA3